ncbi:beta-lactamase-like protein [Chiua virens]|nr:beta-lactamase-like protein [Chiua virens]
MHGDHHIGLAKILSMRQRWATDNVFMYLHEYAALEELGLSPDAKSSVVAISVDAIHWKNDFSSPRFKEASKGTYHRDRRVRRLRGTPSAVLAHHGMCALLGLDSFRSVDVVHRTSCHGAIIKHTDGWCIVYSGDTIPTQKLVQAGENATLLIHESTMADDQAEMAAAKMHSTVGQAIDIGRRRGIPCSHTFPRRYPNIPPSATTEHKPGDPTLALALDHANIKISDMWKMNVYINAIEQSFADLEEENDTTQAVEVDLP